MRDATSLLTLAAVAVAATMTFAGGADPGTAQEAPCSGPRYRAFDFWIGDWVVTNPDGDEVGRNRIRKVAGGCGLLESWTSADGTTGTSLNFYDPAEESWTQVWIGARGLRLHLEGGMDGNGMVLEGERTRDGEQMRDRITWTPREDGSVRQTWETSSGDDGWKTSWVGYYEPSEDG